MRIAFFSIALSTCLLFACRGSKRDGIILEENTMGKVLFDLLQADAFGEQYLRLDSQAKNTRIVAMQQQVFELNRISKEDFQKSYQYYSSNPKSMSRILDSIVSRSERSRSVLMMQRYSNSKQPIEPAGE